jgi:hypothetical protein
MADSDYEDDFDKAFEGFGEDKPATPAPADPAKPADPAAPPAPEAPKVEEPKKDEQPKPEEPKKPEEGTPPADPAKKPEEGAQPPKDPAAPAEPAAPEEPKPLTEEGVKSIISNIRTEERTTAKELDTTTNEVLEAYYPDGLSNVLIDQASGKELRTPQDVVDASGGEMDMESAAKWLMNEQYKLDQDVAKIKDDAQKIAETTINFKRDSVAALQKYEPLFKWQPSLQKKVWEKLKQQVKADTEKGVILSAPDVMDHYDFYLEPYQKAYEFSKGQPATNPNPPAPEAPPAPKPGADDRLDEGGDGGASPVDDPNDFAQQVTKELAKGL